MAQGLVLSPYDSTYILLNARRPLTSSSNSKEKTAAARAARSSIITCGKENQRELPSNSCPVRGTSRHIKNVGPPQDGFLQFTLALSPQQRPEILDRRRERNRHGCVLRQSTDLNVRGVQRKRQSLVKLGDMRMFRTVADFGCGLQLQDIEQMLTPVHHCARAIRQHKRHAGSDHSGLAGKSSLQLRSLRHEEPMLPTLCVQHTEKKTAEPDLDMLQSRILQGSEVAAKRLTRGRLRDKDPFPLTHPCLTQVDFRPNTGVLNDVRASQAPIFDCFARENSQYMFLYLRHILSLLTVSNWTVRFV